jgi:diguanylate cyclase (GGDEF)-like protein
MSCPEGGKVLVHNPKQPYITPPSEVDGLAEFSLWQRIGIYFFRLDIVRKLLLGYFPIFFLLVLFVGLSLLSLNTLNQLTGSIVQTDLPIIEQANGLVDDVLAQELYAKRYSILKGPDTLRFFHEQGILFQKRVQVLTRLPEDRDLDTGQLMTLHKQYQQFLVNHYVTPGETVAPVDIEDQLRQKQKKLINHINQFRSRAVEDQNTKTRRSADMSDNAFRVALIVCWVGLFLALMAAYWVTRSIVTPLRQLTNATERIAEGDFDHIVQVDSGDEIGDLALAFTKMSKRLKVLEASYRDASPLTGLPGGVAIDRVLSNRLAVGKAVTFCMFDIDHFKAYNDRYGYSRGNKVIKMAADVLRDAVEEMGEEGDFAGHIGGDDFVLICKRHGVQDLCQNVLDRFDAHVVEFYSEEDLQNGYIQAKNRKGVVQHFPVAALSGAMVTNEKRRLVNHVQVGEIAAELKKAAKKLPGSALVVDNRSSS